jgi:hypothetical protein
VILPHGSGRRRVCDARGVVRRKTRRSRAALGSSVKGRLYYLSIICNAYLYWLHWKRVLAYFRLGI